MYVKIMKRKQVKMNILNRKSLKYR